MDNVPSALNRASPRQGPPRFYSQIQKYLSVITSPRMFIVQNDVHGAFGYTGNLQLPV